MTAPKPSSAASIASVVLSNSSGAVFGGGLGGDGAGDGRVVSG